MPRSASSTASDKLVENIKALELTTLAACDKDSGGERGGEEEEEKRGEKERIYVCCFATKKTARQIAC